MYQGPDKSDAVMRLEEGTSPLDAYIRVEPISVLKKGIRGDLYA